MSKPKLEYLLALNNTVFTKALSKSVEVTQTTGKKISAGLDPAIAKFKRLSVAADKFTTVGLLASTAAAGIGLSKFNGFLKESVQLANEQESAEAKLAAVLNATGNAAGFTSQQLVSYAGNLQKITTFGDEVTISAMAILATFKEIKGDEFKRATAAAQDMSVILNQDLNSAILQVGKALNSPVKGISALGRAGISFTTSQAEMIKKLQETGNILGAQKIILQELEGEFGGAAEKMRQTFGGAAEAAENALGDLKEAVGFTITKNQFFIQGLLEAERALNEWTTAINENSGKSREYAKQTALSLLNLASTGLTTFDILYRGGNLAAGTFRTGAAAANLTVAAYLKIAQAAGTVTDFLGITSDAADNFKFHAQIALEASDDLATKAEKNFSKFKNGSLLINEARDALSKFANEIKDIPANAAPDISPSINASKIALASAGAQAESYGATIKKVSQESAVELDKVKQAAASQQAQMDNVSAKKVDETATSASTAKDRFVDATSATKDFTEKLVQVNGVWVQQQQSAYDTEQGVTKVGTAIDGLKSNADGFKASWQSTMDEFLESGSEAIYELDTKLSQLVKDRHMTVYVTEEIQSSESRRFGGMIGATSSVLKMASGGAVRWHNALQGLSLPGYGGGDRRHVLAEDGEVMIKKESVRAAGKRAALAFNAGNWGVVVSELVNRMNLNASDIMRRKMGGFIGSVALPPIPTQALAGGGAVSSQPSNNTYHLTVSVNGDTKSSVGIRNLSKAIMADLKKLNRGSSR